MAESPNDTTSDLSIREACAVDEAAAKAVDLIRKYSDIDPHDGSITNPWHHPEDIFQALDNARNDLTRAWDDLQRFVEGDIDKPTINEDDFRAAYMNLVTDAFADVLEELRNNEDDMDVDVLADCLQAGMELFTEDDRELIMNELEKLEDDDSDHQELTPHEIRRRQLGYHNLEAAA